MFFFINCVYELHRHFPTYFSFSTKFLKFILDNMYSSRFDTFLYSSEKHRKDVKKEEKYQNGASFFGYLRPENVKARAEYLKTDMRKTGVILWNGTPHFVKSITLIL